MTNKYLMITAILLCFMFNANAADKQKVWKVTSKETLKIARQYNEYLIYNQVDKAMELVAEDVTFKDITWGGDGVKGKSSLKQIFSGSGGTIHNTAYIERKVFKSRDTVVIFFTLSGDMDLTEDGTVEQRFHGIADMMRVLTIKNGKITNHIDLADYDSFMPDIAAHRAKLNK